MSTIEKPTILIVDDDSDQRALIAEFLSGHSLETVTAGSGEEALQKLADGDYAMMISDVRMPGVSGLEVLQEARKSHPDLPVLLVTAFADVRDAVNAMKDGALNYLEKPIDFEELIDSVRHALGQPVDPATAMGPLPELPDGVLVASPGMHDLLHEVAMEAPAKTRVLITGDSGVGKEVIADLVHYWSKRSSQPCVKVNCAALPENLLESELFGHEKGAFTGATETRIGRFEEASGGTIFLDEIGEMSASLQAKLLRVTQDGSFHRIGSNEERHADARLIAATNRNLERDVADGTFREDLYYRLSVIELHVPPLRDRSEEIVPLARAFASEFSKDQARLSSATVTALSVYGWPGNIRELRNAMERAALMCRGNLIMPEHLPKRIREETGVTTDLPADEGAGRMKNVERAVILETLRQNGYNRSETARVLGISRRTLIYKLHRFAEEGHDVDGGSDS